MTFEEKDRIVEGDIETSEPDVHFGRMFGIPHYWGTAARQLMVAGAALLLFASPLYGDDLKREFPFEVLGALLAVGFAALTNPRERWTSLGDAAICAVVAATYAIWGINNYSSDKQMEFVLRLAIATVFLFAFYFSMKTVRAFSLRQVGRHDRMDDFDTEKTQEDTVEEAEHLFSEEERR
jgi:hypothetical protein